MKKIISLGLSVVIIVSLFATYSFASNTTKTKKMLIENGIPVDIIEMMPKEQIAEAAYRLENQPDKIQFEVWTMEVNELGFIRDAYLLSNTKLKEKYKLSTEQCVYIKEKAHRLSLLSNEEMKTKLNYNDVAIKLIRDALKGTDKNGVNYGEVSASSTISTNKLTINNWVYNDSGSSGHDAVDYRVYFYFKWESAPFWDMFTDKIATAWGGDMCVDDDFTSGYTYYKNWETGINTIRYMQNSDFTENPINAGMVAQFPQRINLNASQSIGSGQMSYRFFKTTKNSPAIASKIISQYAQQKVTIGGLGIDISATPAVSISIGYGYNTSEQKKYTIYY